jgi:transcriptional regulator with PAS, ATPase and Fis domain
LQHVQNERKHQQFRICENQLKERREKMNINKLKGKIVERGLNVEKLAKLIGVDRATLYRKLNVADTRITIGEATKMKSVLELTEAEAIEIFFN